MRGEWKLAEADVRRWCDRLSQPEETERLRTALKQLPAGAVVKMYKSCFVSRDEAESFRMVRVPFRKVTAAPIIAHLEDIQRIRQKVTWWLAHLFITMHSLAIQALLGSDTPPNTTPESEECLRWVLEEDLKAIEPGPLIARWREAARQAERERQEALDEQVSLRETVKRLEASLQVAEARQQEELRHWDAERRELLANSEKGQQQLVAEWEKRLHHQHDQNEEIVAQLVQHVEDLEGEVDALKVELGLQNGAQIRALERHWQHEKGVWETQRHDLLQQLAHEHAVISQLRRDLEQVVQAPPLLPGDDEELGQALILEYERLGEDPATRILNLFAAYRDLRAGTPSDLLQEASNLEALGSVAPSGLLIVGLERLLDDGASLPLERFMRTRIFQQEARLARLLAQVKGKVLS